ncbi:hypothetical protein FNV43_RR21676 [Rhamnella rubrinervis]|uniref:60S ribosomal protein L7a n=1 Tax=Rhamnella rubrinervis TaxID=2594499 RepID=A0A8K0GRD0_9ROSA|nr:hypothetical protein FNV43_RR21676 [Rhamnella rubrinervis]
MELLLSVMEKKTMRVDGQRRRRLRGKALKRGGKAPVAASKKKPFGIEGALPLKRDLTRFVKWPMTVQIQRKRRILKQRLKVPPTLNQITKTLDKNLRHPLQYLLGLSNAFMIPYSLLYSNKAQLVVFAHDVDPIELVVWLPAFSGSLIHEAREAFISALVSEDKGHRKCLILWHGIQEWANIILNFVKENGLKDNVMTVEEIRSGIELRGTALINSLIVFPVHMQKSFDIAKNDHSEEAILDSHLLNNIPG